MAIVVHCPNGHRVKVKDEFAGKRVLCPTCQAKTRVPPAAPPAAGLPEAEPVEHAGHTEHTGEASLPTAQLLRLPPAKVASLPRAYPFDYPR